MIHLNGPSLKKISSSTADYALRTNSIKRGKTYFDVFNHLGEVLVSLGEVVVGRDEDLGVS